MKLNTLRLENLEVRDCPTGVVNNLELPVAVAPTTAVYVGEAHIVAAATKISLDAPAAGSTALEAQVAAFARGSVGTQVAAPNAFDCAALAAAALASAGARQPPDFVGVGPIADHYGWGSVAFQRSAVGGYDAVGDLGDVRPGDVIQVDQYGESRSDGSWITAWHHTAVVESVDAKTGTINIIQQNWNGVATAERGVFVPGAMNGGVITVYRPVAA